MCSNGCYARVFSNLTKIMSMLYTEKELYQLTFTIFYILQSNIEIKSAFFIFIFFFLEMTEIEQFTIKMLIHNLFCVHTNLYQQTLQNRSVSTEFKSESFKLSCVSISVNITKIYIFLIVISFGLIPYYV